MRKRPVPNEAEPGPSRITQRQLAEQLGVSPATVSLAMRGSPLVARSTRERVVEAMRRSGYVYNRSAASLRTRTSHIVGVAFHDITNPYFAELLAAVEAKLSATGRTVFLSNHGDDLDRQTRFLDGIRQHDADGLLLSPAFDTDPAAIEGLVSSGVPVVCVARRLPDVPVEFAGHDDVTGMRLVTEHLIALGHRRIAMVGASQRGTAGRERAQGYEDALSGHGIAFDPALQIPGAATREAGQQGVHRAMALSPRPTAVVCFNDLVAFGAMMGLRRLGLEPGRDVAVTGCDDIAEAAETVPGLTTVANRPRDVGDAAADLLLKRIADPARPPQQFLVTPTLSVRESSGPPLG